MHLDHLHLNNPRLTGLSRSCRCRLPLVFTRSSRRLPSLPRLRPRVRLASRVELAHGVTAATAIGAPGGTKSPPLSSPRTRSALHSYPFPVPGRRAS